MVVLEELTGRKLEQLIARGGRTVVIPFGSVEHQGRHLPLGSDALLADVVGAAVADRVDAVLAPTVRVGSADEHMGGIGTVTVPSETLRAVAFHMARSLIVHGFRVIALIPTHGGNQAALEQAAQQLKRQHSDVSVCVPRGDVGADPGAHSGRWLTSVMLTLRPELVDVESADDKLRDEVTAATPQAGRENLERFVASIVKAVRDASQAPSRGTSDAGQ